MHYALRLLCCVCCPVQQSCSVQSSPFFLSQKSDPRTSSPSFRFRPEILFFARLRGWAAEEKEEDDEDEKEELRISWVVFCGWRECRCSAVAGVKWEVVGGWVLMNGSHVAATEDFLVW